MNAGKGITMSGMACLDINEVGGDLVIEIISVNDAGFWKRLVQAIRFAFFGQMFMYSMFVLERESVLKLNEEIKRCTSGWENNKNI
jgi:hypothetical protein